jgi:hypothetical protein
MVQVECPWCDGPAVVESVDAPEGVMESLARAA